MNDLILLKCHDPDLDDFSVLLNEGSVFKLHLKETLLIKKGQPEGVDRNVYSYPLELFD